MWLCEYMYFFSIKENGCKKNLEKKEEKKEQYTSFFLCVCVTVNK